MELLNNPEDSRKLRQAIRERFAFPGGYELVFITDDGAALCAECARANYCQIAHSRRYGTSDGWRVVGIDTSAGCEESTLCDQCGRELSPYVED